MDLSRPDRLHPVFEAVGHFGDRRVLEGRGHPLDGVGHTEQDVDGLGARRVLLELEQGPAHLLEVLRGLAFELQAGDRIAIRGQSGVGKSTLLHILGTLDRPTSGKLRFRGEDVFAKSPEELARLRNRFVGFVFQFHHLLPEFSALENVMMPGLLQKRDFREMREAAGKMLAECIATQRTPDLIAPFRLSRFGEFDLVGEAGAASVAN